MKGEHKRIVELAAGWEGSDADVFLSPADAELLKSVGAPVEGTPDKAADPPRIKGVALVDAAARLQASDAETPEGAEPTPNQQSVTGPGADPRADLSGAKNEPTHPDADPAPQRPAGQSPEGFAAEPAEPANPTHRKRR